MILKLDYSKSKSFLKLKQFVNELCDYESTRKVNAEESEDEEEIPAILISYLTGVISTNATKSGRLKVTKFSA